MFLGRISYVAAFLPHFKLFVLFLYVLFAPLSTYLECLIFFFKPSF